MKISASSPILVISVSLVVVGGLALAAQDKYTVQVPNGLAFSEFKGYEDWQSVSVSKTDHAFALILANPVMIDAYREGIPNNGKPFPDGSKMAKIHWKPEKSAEAPDPTTAVPGTLLNVDFMERDSKRFADSGGWGWAAFNYEAASDTFTPATEADQTPQGTTPNAVSRAIRLCMQRTTFSRRTRSGERRDHALGSAVATLNAPKHKELDMGSSQVRSQTANETSRAQTVDMKLEVVVIPVSNVDRAKDFYRSLGWRPDADFAGDDNFRVIQFTPPGSGCSVIFGKNITAAAPGSIMFASNVMRRCALRGPAEARHFFERAGEPTFASAV